ncbi:MmpS family transport accessory protein [Nonomuraea sp. NPDC049709]|uniref:MmpS family transport accessory protein n=1 Tax=Nonomuraea sp. NPDC049709 TaxID=3154736 RepID=UPI0034418B6B
MGYPPQPSQDPYGQQHQSGPQYQQPYQPQPYSQPGHGGGYERPPETKTNGLAVAALVTGLTGFLTCGFTSILAVIFGHVALSQIRRDGTDGRGMAVGGVVLGWVLTGSWLLFWALSWTGVISSFLYAAASPTAVAGPARSRLDVDQQPGGTNAPAQGDQAVVFEVTGDGGATSIGTLTYMSGLELKQESGVPLPYTKELTSSDPFPLSLIAQNAGQGGTITCRIKVAGKVVRESTGTGAYGVCNVRADTP